MKIIKSDYMKNILFFLLTFLMISHGIAQKKEPETKNEIKKERKWRFYGGMGFGFVTGGGSDVFYIQVQPGILYKLTNKWEAGAGLYYSYYTYREINGKVQSNIYGGNLLTTYQPVKQLETSLEFQYLFLNQKYLNQLTKREVPSLFIGLGYRMPHAVIGFKYDLLYRENNGISPSAFQPFVRIYF